MKITSTDCKANDNRSRIFDFCLYNPGTVYQINVKGYLRGNHEWTIQKHRIHGEQDSGRR